MLLMHATLACFLVRNLLKGKWIFGVLCVTLCHFSSVTGKEQLSSQSLALWEFTQAALGEDIRHFMIIITVN